MRRAGERRGNARLSYTDRCGYSEYCWKTKATSRVEGGAPVMSRPSIRNHPASGASRPAATIACVRRNRFETPASRTSATGGLLVEGRAQDAAGPLLEDGQLLRAERQPGVVARAHRDLGRDPRFERRALRRGDRDDLRGPEVLGVQHRGAQRGSG